MTLKNHHQTPFDDKIDALINGIAHVVRHVAKDVNHTTDDIADAVGKFIRDHKGEQAVYDADIDATTKMGK